MQLHDAVNDYIHALKPIQLNAQVARRVFSLVDLTSLNESDTEASIATFCEKANSPIGHVAAACVYPRFVRLVADSFSGTAIKTATVVNFPKGTSPLESVLIEISNAIQDGAQEIDMVFPYSHYLAGDKQYAGDFVSTCKTACGRDALLKVILETGALNDPAIIADAANTAFLAGADFVKTSTGKIAQGATPEAVATILLVAKQLSTQLKRTIGVKVSGGVRTLEQAARYVELADAIMGRQWVTPATFRIGASRLVDEISRIMK